MFTRFQAYRTTGTKYNINDNQAIQFSLPSTVLFMNVREEAANSITKILNEEWELLIKSIKKD